MQKKNTNQTLIFITALLLILIALLTGSTLLLLSRMHGRSAHTAAAESVIKQGKSMAARLAVQPAVTSTDESAGWSEFSHLVRNLHSIENGLQYVSVTRGGLVLFHEQTSLLDSDNIPSNEPQPPPESATGIRREILHIGNRTIPVVVFTVTVHTPDGTPTDVKVALRKDTVSREEKNTEAAITSMFQLSLLTVLISFATCVALVVWMMRREVKREEQRREAEHLAFSGMLANGIVHDFRNPMSSIRLDSQMLQRETERSDIRPERIRKLSSRIRNTLDRMDKVFKEFLYVSRPDTNQREKIDIAASLRDSLDMLAPRFEQLKLKLNTNIPDEKMLVTAYEGSLRRALVNVLTNAIQFSPPESTISVELTKSADNIIVEISDEGPGIPENRRKKVFEMFETSRPEGTGLGLFIAKTAIERANGSIAVAAPPNGIGACIRITLPAA